MDALLALLAMAVLVAMLALWEWGDSWRRRYYELLRAICPEMD